MPKGQQMMRGDSFDLDYLVISRLGAVAIGVKPFIEPIYITHKSTLRFLIGLDFCLSAFPGERLINAEYAARKLCSDVPWTYLSRTCCRVRFGTSLPPFPEGLRPEGLAELLKEARFINKLICHISNFITSHEGLRIETNEEIEEFITTNYVMLADKHIHN